ncbi:MAG: TRAP transporter small permease [Deltaproteobacteria bacterium]|nr:MAG: TRAP transporter small permease [Deltaproteobacteria bacterium]
MPVLQRFETFNQKISSAIEWVGLIGFLVMMLITTVDVIGAKVFLSPVFGALDIVMQAQLIAMSFAAATTLIAGRHVAVEFFVPLLPKPLQKVVDIFVNLLGLALFVIIVWRLTEYAYSLQTVNEVTPTARIPLCPFAYGTAIASIPVCLVYLCYLLESMMRLIKR